MNKINVMLLQNKIEEYIIIKNNIVEFDNKYIIDSILNEFPSLSQKEAECLLNMFIELSGKNKNECIDLSVTAPNSFSIKAETTSVTMYELLKNAEKSILITGYSISDYFDDLLDIIVSKIKKGVLVKLFLNDFDSKKDILDKLLLYKGRFLEIYNFNKSKKGIEALHAKVISVDSKKSLITSANLSFNGLQKNIEVGSIINSSRIARNIEDMFYKLKNMKVFSKIE